MNEMEEMVEYYGFDLVIHQKDLSIDQLHQLKENLLSEWKATTFRANRIQKQLDQVFDLLCIADPQSLTYWR